MMSSDINRCKKLRRLHRNLMEELRILREDLAEEEREAVNPVETASIIKSLQKTLNTVEIELQKCRDTEE